MAPPRTSPELLQEIEQIRQEIRRALDYESLRSIAAAIGMSPSHVDNILGGAVPRRSTLRKLREWCDARSLKELPTLPPPPIVTSTSGRAFALGKLNPVYLSRLEEWAVQELWRFRILCADTHQRRYPEIARSLGIDGDDFRRFLVGDVPHDFHYARMSRYKPAEGVEPDPAVLIFGVFLSQVHASGVPVDENGALRLRIVEAISSHCAMKGVPVPTWISAIRTMRSALNAAEGL